MFKDHSIKRTYQAVALGNVKAGKIESSIARDRGDGIRGSVAKDSKGAQHAVTHVRPVKGFGDYTLIECRLETGRTHQIRIHLSEQGHMLCGERVYCKTLDGRHVVDSSGAPRLALHAVRLQFRHPVTGKKIEVESKWPKDLQTFIDRLSHGPKKSRGPNDSGLSRNDAVRDPAISRRLDKFDWCSIFFGTNESRSVGRGSWRSFENHVSNLW
ncbi:MAG: RluA family pseudouridine synthase [Pirellulaceae bacterium]